MEFALIAPLLILLLLGIAEVGFNLSNAQQMRSGTSTAARNAVVLGSPTGSCVPETTPPDSTTADLVCDIKARSTMDGVRVRVVVPSGWVRGEALVVCSQRRMDSLTGVFPFLNGQFITTRSEYRIERIDSAGPVTFEESPPTGGTWAWCTT